MCSHFGSRPLASMTSIISIVVSARLRVSARLHSTFSFSLQSSFFFKTQNRRGVRIVEVCSHFGTCSSRKKGEEEGQCKSCDEANGGLVRDILAEWLRRRLLSRWGPPTWVRIPRVSCFSANFKGICCSCAYSYDLDVSVCVRICPLRYRTRNAQAT